MPIKPKIVSLETVGSTNEVLCRHAGDEKMVVATAEYQTAGRGCGTNVWESERGKNLLYSVLYRPSGVEAANQFVLSMANALALKAALDGYTKGISIKWPNDIYLGDGKLCGTLIETTLRGKLVDTVIAGTGINVNQRTFRSDAPNPVALAAAVGHDVNRKALLDEVISHTIYYMCMAETEPETLRERYRQALYRRGEWHRYRFADGAERMALLETVADDGRLLLRHAGADGDQPTTHAYAFKEVAFVIEHDNQTNRDYGTI